MSSNNVGHLITRIITTLQHFATLHHTSLNNTSLHLSTLHFLSFTLHYPLIWLNPFTFPIVLFRPNIVRVIKSRRMRWAGHVARMGEERGAYRVLVVKPEGKRPLGRPRRRWVDNIRMDLQGVGFRYVDWIGLAQDRDTWQTLVSAVMNLRVP